MASRAEVLPVVDLGGDLEFLWGCGLVFLRFGPRVTAKLVYRRGLHGYKTSIKKESHMERNVEHIMEPRCICGFIGNMT